MQGGNDLKGSPARSEECCHRRSKNGAARFGAAPLSWDISTRRRNQRMCQSRLIPGTSLTPHLFLAGLNQTLASWETLSMNLLCQMFLSRWCRWCHHPAYFFGRLWLHQTLIRLSLTLLRRIVPCRWSAHGQNPLFRKSSLQARWIGQCFLKLRFAS